MSIETHVFIVRIWREDSDQADAEDIWRGSVETVPKGQRTYFLSIDELTAALAERTGLSNTDGGG